jgi:uncharacterized membrane protein
MSNRQRRAVDYVIDVLCGVVIIAFLAFAVYVVLHPQAG